MSATAAAVCGVLGLPIGLALNVVIDRVPARQRLLPLRFRCPRCPPGPEAAETAEDAEAPASRGGPEVPGGTEETFDHPGLPVGSWLRPGSPCPACGQPLPAQYLLVPLLTAALLTGVGLRLGWRWVLPAYLVFFASLTAISVIDLRLRIIPNRIVYPTIFASIPLLALAAAADGEWHRLRDALIGAALGWAMLLVIHLISPGGMGFGDVRLAFVLGLFLGWLSLGHVLAGIFLGFLLGSVLGVALIATGLRRRTDHIPFGPFLAAGAALAVFAGRPIIRWLVGG